MSDIKLVCFDLNHTLIQENSWYDLNLALGITAEEDAVLFRFYEEGAISYLEWMRLLVELYKKRGKANRNVIVEAISKYSFLPGAQESVTYLKEKGYEIVLISGAMDLLVSSIAKELDIDYFEANSVFIFDEHDMLEDVITFGQDELAKLRHLENFCRKLGLKLSECACIGDGANDAALFRKTGNGITFSGSPIEHEARHVIKNLSELPTIL